MKLFTIASRLYILSIVAVFTIGGLLAYFIMKSIIDTEFNEKLIAEKEQLIYELHTYQDLKDTYYLNIGDRINLQEMTNQKGIKQSISDTIMYDPFERKQLPFRTLTFSDRFQNKNYKVTITKSLLPNQDLVRGISEIFLIMFGSLMISLLVLNRIISKKIWSPFFKLKDQVQAFNLSRPDMVVLEDSEVSEFQVLKEAVEAMMQQTLRDYQNLKEYTENTSHEIQTPLAIIKNKTELLLQEKLTKNQMSEVGKIYEAATRLSKLKEGLALLTKIENNQFIKQESIDVRQFIERKLNNLQELIDIRKIKVTTKFFSALVIMMNYDLAYLLITNLLSNAIKHNIKGGNINIVLRQNVLTVSNTGVDPGVSTNELFERFKRSSTGSDSTGLGLAIVKRIVDFCKLDITYTYAVGKHSVILEFPSD